MSVVDKPIESAKQALGDLRFGSRALGIAGYSLWCYARFEVEARGRDDRGMDDLISETMHRYGRRMSDLFGLDIRTAGLPASRFLRGADAAGRGRIFVSNHRSALDILATLAFIEGKHVSRADLAGWPIIGLVARRVGILFVDRENRRSSADVMKKMIDYVDKGIGVVIFPEGTTYAGDEVRPFKAGAFTVARRTKAEIVPLGICYAGDGLSFGDESLLDHMRRVSGAPRTQIAISFGEPIHAGNLDSHALSNLVQEKVQEQVNRARALF